METEPVDLVVNAPDTLVLQPSDQGPAKHRTKRLKVSEKVDKAALWAQFDEHVKQSKGQVKEVPLDELCPTKCETDREVCDSCQTILRFTEEGFLGCPKPECGRIYTDIIDHGAEWRFFGGDDHSGPDPTRCGLPINPLLQQASFSCKIGCSNKSSFEMRQLCRYNNWQTMPYAEKSRYDDFQRISTLAEQGGLPKIIIDDAMRFHKKISDAKTFRGLNRDGIIAATIYIACKTNNYPRTAKEIANIFHLDHTSATRGCKNAMSIVNEIESEMDMQDKTVLCNTMPTSFIERYCSKLNINSELTKLCQFVALCIEEQNLMPENTPHSIAAGVVYFVGHECGLNVTKLAVHEVSEISEVTINKCFKKLETMRDVLIPEMVRDKYKSQ